MSSSREEEILIQIQQVWFFMGLYLISALVKRLLLHNDFTIFLLVVIVF